MPSRITHRLRQDATRLVSALCVALLLQTAAPQPFLLSAPAPPKLKLRGYLTERLDDHTLAILDDHIQLGPGTHMVMHGASSDRPATPADIAVGQLIEAEGSWSGRHQFSAEKISVELGLLEKTIRETAYLQEEPTQTAQIAGGEPAELKTDGEWLVLSSETHRQWSPPVAPAASSHDASSSDAAASPAAPSFAAYQVRYAGTRRSDGKIGATLVELHPPAPSEAYKNPHDVTVVPAKDPQSGIDVIEFRRGTKVDARMKLFPVHAVQEYVSDLGDSLLPPGAHSIARPLEFRFFVVEDPSINASSLPDGTLLVNTGLLAVVQNEAQLAFVLSHEIAHVLQAHVWREANETRAQRTGLLIAGLVGGYFVGDLSIFLSGLGMAAVVNGHQRALENQADRLGLQNIIDRGYDPRQGPRFLRAVIERYGDRSTSRLWSDHDSSLLRGSFLTVQLAAQYPQGHFDGARVDTPAFQAMREAMGPVKIE
jgi:Peptidase family M48